MNILKKLKQNKILNFKKFLEAVSGTFDISPMGPGMPRQELGYKPSEYDTKVIFTEITDKIYSYDDYIELYNLYLENGGEPLHGFNKENLEKVLTYNK